MAKKDAPLNEEVRREEDADKGSSAISSRNNNTNNEQTDSGETEIKNANASGMGSMGRNDERLTDHTSNHSADS